MSDLDKAFFTGVAFIGYSHGGLEVAGWVLVTMVIAFAFLEVIFGGHE